MEADALVDAVRKELTNLVHELRPQAMDGQDFSETLKEYAMEWSHRSGIELNFNIEGNGELSLETRETLFRIAQEALANVARHSSASCVDVSLEYGTDTVTMTIKDDGRGFDPQCATWRDRPFLDARTCRRSWVGVLPSKARLARAPKSWLLCR